MYSFHMKLPILICHFKSTLELQRVSPISYSMWSDAIKLFTIPIDAVIIMPVQNSSIKEYSSRTIQMTGLASTISDLGK